MSDPIIQVLKRLAEKYPPGKNVEFKHQYVRFNEKEQPASKDKTVVIPTTMKKLPACCDECTEIHYGYVFRNDKCRVTGEEIDGDGETKRLDSCPLIELEEK